MTNPTHYLVPAEPTEEMVDAANFVFWENLDADGNDMKSSLGAALAASPNAGKVSREQLDMAARKLREHRDELHKLGLDKPWDALADKQRNIHRVEARVVFAVLGLQVEED